MRWIAFAVLALLSRAVLAAPSWVGSLPAGVAPSNPVNLNSTAASVAFWLCPRVTNGVQQEIFDSSTNLANSTATAPRFGILISNRSSGWRLEGIIRGSSYKSTWINASLLPLNAWSHIGMVLYTTNSAGTVRIFLNGILQAATVDTTLTSASLTAGSFWATNYPFLGSANTNSIPLNGAVADLGIWSGILPDAQFAELANRRPGHLLAVRPVSYWPLDPVEGEFPLLDLVGGNHFTRGTYAVTNSEPGLYR